MTCYSCRWSIGSIDGLLCKLLEKPACERCPKFEYEAGTDEVVHDETLS